MNTPSSITPQTTQTQTESVTTLNLNEDTTANWAAAESYLAQRTGGARWFYWLAVLSLVNAVVVHLNGSWSFLAGLAVTLVISGFAVGLSEELGTGVLVIAFALEFLIAAVFAAFGYFAIKGHNWAFIIGGICYMLDGLIFLLFGDWLGLAFHAFVLYGLYRGFSANQSYGRLQADGMA